MRIRTQLILLTFGRFLLTTALRFFFPFKPQIRAGLGISVAQFDQLIALRSLAGFVGPILVPLSERFGRKLFIVGGMLLFCVGTLLIPLLPVYFWVGVALVVIGLAKVLFDPTVQAHLGDIVPYEKRGKAMAAMETSWSTALLIGAPVMGFVLARWGWQSPFILLAIGSAVFAVIYWRVIPESRSAASRQRVTLHQMLVTLRQKRSLWALSLYAFLMLAANQILFLSYAEWMQETFALSLGGLGVTAAVIGSAELLGEGVSGWASDRFGKKRVVLIAALLSVIANVLVPHADNSFAVGLIALFAVFCTFEVAFITIIPIYSEAIPEARTVALATLALTSPAGRGIGSLVAAPIALSGGFVAAGWVAGVMGIVAVGVFGRYVSEQ